VGNFCRYYRVVSIVGDFDSRCGSVFGDLDLVVGCLWGVFGCVLGMVQFVVVFYAGLDVVWVLFGGNG